MKCSCGSDHVVCEMVSDGVRRKCGACGAIIQSAAAVAAATQPSREQIRAAAPTRPQVPQRSRRERDAAMAPSMAPANPIPAMRARLRWLDSEIKRLRKLEVERESLARILSAASGKPVAVVRELRRSQA